MLIQPIICDKMHVMEKAKPSLKISDSVLFVGSLLSRKGMIRDMTVPEGIENVKLGVKLLVSDKSAEKQVSNQTKV